MKVDDGLMDFLASLKGSNHPLERINERAAYNIWARFFRGRKWEEFDSPIEASFYLALIMEVMTGPQIFANVMSPGRGMSRLDSLKDGVLIIENQIDINGWRVDFLIRILGVDGIEKKLIVECDGHEFHERTKDQAAKDRSRDRAVQQAGYTIFRFTGSEIWRDTCKCADAVMEWIAKA